MPHVLAVKTSSGGFRHYVWQHYQDISLLLTFYRELKFEVRLFLGPLVHLFCQNLPPEAPPVPTVSSYRILTLQMSNKYWTSLSHIPKYIEVLTNQKAVYYKPYYKLYPWWQIMTTKLAIAINAGSIHLVAQLQIELWPINIQVEVSRKQANKKPASSQPASKPAIQPASQPASQTKR